MNHLWFKIQEKLYFKYFGSKLTDWLLMHTHFFERIERALDKWIDNQDHELEEFF